jgi:hypothetical protein
LVLTLKLLINRDFLATSQSYQARRNADLLDYIQTRQQSLAVCVA